MTAPDPRLGEIEARLAAATPGPWEWDSNDVTQCGEAWDSVIENTVSCGSYCYGGSVQQEVKKADAEFIAAAPADVAYLIAELRKRDEALARVQGFAGHLDRLGYGATAKGIRAAVAAATGGGE